MKISIDGNIGSGKSSLIKNIEEYLDNRENIYNASKLYQYRDNISLIQEPVSLWKPYLNNFYKDMKNNGLALQMKILKHHLSVPNENIVITERSSKSCVDIFGKHLYNSELLNSLDISLMKDYENSFGNLPDVYIYIDTPPQICGQRIDLRNRESEDKISIDYLENIDKLYSDMYSDKIKNLSYKVDGKMSPKDVLGKTIEILDNIL